MRRLMGLVLASGLAFGMAAPISAETLADALISAYKNSNLLDQNQAVLRAADEGVAQAVAALRPVVEYNASISAARQRSQFSPDMANSLSQSLSISASMTVYDFGRSDLGIKLAQESVLATRQSLVSI